MMFDLNKMPDSEEEEEEEVEEITTERPNVPNNTQGYRNMGHHPPLIGPWQTLTPSELASLYNMVHVPVNCPRVHHVITHRANGTAEHAWISWLPAPNAAPPGGTSDVNHSSEWRTLPSIFHPPAPTLAVPPIASRPPVRASAPDHHVSSAFFDPRRLWSHDHHGLQRRPPTTTNVADMECQGESEQSESNDNRLSFRSAVRHRNVHIRGKKPMMESRTAVRLMEVGPAAQEVPVPVEVRTLLRSAQNQQTDIGSSSQHGAEISTHDEADRNSESANVGAQLLDHMAREERRRMREEAFLAEFDFTTERCIPTAPCSRCLAFFKRPLPVDLADSGDLCLVGGGLDVDDDSPPVLKNMDEGEAAQKRGARHGPKSKSSQYRGVTYYKRTGRWESHIWHEAAQVYLGASATKEEAAKAYDKAAIMLGGPDVDINFEPVSYQSEMRYLYKLSKEQLVIYLRRDSRGFGAQAAYPGVKHVKNHYQAICGATLLGTFSTEEEAARIVYRTAIDDSFGALASIIIDTHHVRNMPSFAAQRFAALYPEAVEAMMMNTQTKTPKKGSKAFSPPSKCSSPSTRVRPSFESPPATPRATASPNPEEQLPPIQSDETGPSAAKRSRSTWVQHLGCRTPHKQTWPARAAAARNPAATSVEPPASSSRPACHTANPGVGVSRLSPTSGFSGIGRTAAPPPVPACSVSSSPWKKRPIASNSAPTGFIKFKLFNVEITVAEEKAAPEEGGPSGQGRVNPRGAQTLRGAEAGKDLYTPPANQFDKLVLPRKRCKTTGEWSPYLPHALATQMASGLNNVEAINNRLHEILAEKVPEAPRTRLTQERQAAPLPKRNRCNNHHRYPNCRCQQQFRG